jgi:hypothetical protein
VSPARRITGSNPAHRLPAADPDGSGPHEMMSLDDALMHRAPAVAAAMVEGAAPGGLPLWAKIAGVPATVLLLAGLLVASQQRSDAALREARADARQDRAEFRAAIDKLATSVERSATAQEKTTAAVEELRRDLARERSGRGKER